MADRLVYNQELYNIQCIYQSKSQKEIMQGKKWNASLNLFIYSGLENKLLQLILIPFHFAVASAAL